MNEDRILSQIEVFKLHFEDNLSDNYGQTISFDEAIKREHKTKRALVEAVQELIKEEANPETLGSKFYVEVKKRLKSINRHDKSKFKKLKDSNSAMYNDLCSIFGQALLSTDDEVNVFQSSFEKILQYDDVKTDNDPSRSILYHLLFVALACKQNSNTIFGMVRFFGDVTEFFLGKRLLQFNDKELKQNFVIFNEFIAQLYDIMTNQWGWNVKDNLDVQSALWIEIKEKEEKYKSYLNPNRTKQIQSKVIEIKKAYTETETLAIVKQRRGQNDLRKKLIEKNKGQCVLTHIKTLELLRVSHIKPWSNSNNNERLDPKNCLVLSGLWDLAFDSGLITFDEGGKLLYSEKLKKDKIASRHPVINSRIILDAEQGHYMKWHRKYIFQQ